MRRPATRRRKFQRARRPEEVRRQQILTAARTLLAERGVSELSLNELARRSGVSKPNVYRYFESREDVLLQWRRVARGARLRCAPLVAVVQAANLWNDDHTSRSQRRGRTWKGFTVSQTTVATRMVRRRPPTRRWPRSASSGNNFTASGTIQFGQHLEGFSQGLSDSPLRCRRQSVRGRP